MPHVLLKTSHIHLRRRAGGKHNFVSLSGVTENFPRIFAIYHRYLTFLKLKTALYMYKRVSMGYPSSQ